MKSVKIDVKTGETAVVDDGQAAPTEIATPVAAPEGVDLEDVKKLVKYAKGKGWIT